MRPRDPNRAARRRTDNRKQTTVRIVSGRRVLAALVLLAAFGAEASAQSRKKAPAPRSEFVDWVELIELEGRLAAQGRPVRVGYFAGPGARLELAQDSRATFRLGQAGAYQGAFELKGPASFAVHGGRQAGVDLFRGRLLAALPALRSPFHVHSRGLAAVVRGTDLYLDAGGRNDLYVCACRGSVDITDNLPRGYRRSIKSEEHAGVAYKVGSGAGGSTLESDHALEGHSDDELEALHALVR